MKMESLNLLGVLLLDGLASCFTSRPIHPKDATDMLVEQGMHKLEAYLRETPASGGCSLETATRRYEWGDLSAQDRKGYTDAVLCLEDLPPRSDPAGAWSRFDDFIASAYPGLQLPLYPPPYNAVPPSEGGGCVTTGPFANMSVNLGPVFVGLPDVPANPQTDGLGYNLRCLKRDVNVHAARETTTNYTENLIAHSNNVYWFQTIMNGRAEIGEWGVHTAGQFTIGGDPGRGFFV
ncbi:hypothetical protein SUNI508_08122 [Seiridium unicorne]|uniref:Tyrosinase copper-binding domain-containing protein n=1 Tax=Seiridium unicorne TaxID=138068 RepID=A0ABR2UVR2_9PEZI